MSDSPSQGILLSVVFHAMIFGVLLGLSYFNPGSLRVQSKVYQVNLVSIPAKKVAGKKPGKAQAKVSDQLPQATIEQIKKIQKPKESGAMKEIVQKKKPEKKTPQKKVDINKSLKDEIARIKDEIQLEQRIASIAKEAQEASDAEGEGSGQDDSGEAGIGNQGSEDGIAGGFGLVQYQDKVRHHIMSAWNLPKWSLESLPKETVAILLVFIAKDGQVLRVEFEKSSNVTFFDQSALRAVRRAAPLPSPPEELAREAKNKGLALRFSPRKMN